MDKLAKALNRARAERASTGVHTPAAAYVPQAPIIPPGHHSSFAVIDEAHLERRRIIAHRTRHQQADIFRILRTQVLQSMQQSGLRTLGITSPNYGDGKTTVALNLALSIALDMNQTVLLVDLDLRKPNVLDYLGLTSPVGLTDYFLRDLPIHECLIRTGYERLSILPAGRALDHSSEVLGSPKIAALAEEMKSRYADRIIIYDLPPTLTQDDPIVFMPHIDAALLVINQGVTTTADLKRAMHTLAQANVIGTVLNHSQGHPATPGGLLGRFRRTKH